MLGLSIAASSSGLPFTFSMGTPDRRIATASQPGSPGAIEIESADDFILGSQTTIDHATFTGLLPSGAPLSSVQQVVVEIYRVFPKDSTDPLLGHVPTGVNSPSDVASDSRDNAAANLTFTSFASGTFHGRELSRQRLTGIRVTCAPCQGGMNSA